MLNKNNTNNTMNSNHNILHTFLKKVEFLSPNAPELFFSRDDSSATIPTNVHVTIQKSGNYAGIYMVNLQTILNSQLDSGKAIFNIDIVYSAIVKIEDDVDEVECTTILKQIVPMRLHDSMRVLVWSLTSLSGFPAFMLNEYDPNMSECENDECNEDLLDFNINDNDDEFDYDGEEDDGDVDCMRDFDDQTFIQCSIDHPLNYDWMIEQVRSSSIGEKYLPLVKQIFNCSISSFNDLPIYKCFFRFLKPIKYKHPNYKECDETLWPILFQLLFGLCDDVYICDQQDGIPEIEFTYMNWSKRRVSSLSLLELQTLVSALTYDTFTSMVTHMLGVELDNSVLALLDEGQMVPKKLFYAQFKSKDGDGVDSLDFVEQYYKRIQNWDMQTFGYTF